MDVTDETYAQQGPKHFADAEEVVIAETGQRFYRVHGGAHDRRWSPTVETASGFLSDARLFGLGTVEVVPADRVR